LREKYKKDGRGLQKLQVLFVKMKSKFNKNWVASKQPRKQRKFLANAPNHIKRRLMASHLNKTLKTKYEIRSIEVRKGDEVKIMRGSFKKKQAKVSSVDIKNTRIQLEGINRSKKDGEKVPVWFHPSNVLIVKLEDSDTRRLKHVKKINSPKETKPDKDVKEIKIDKEVKTIKTKELKK